MAVKSENDVEIESLCFSYNRKQIFSSSTLYLPKGEKVLISGSNGCGKTTFLKIILGILRPDSGNVIVLGKETGSTLWRNNRRDTAFLNQESITDSFPLSSEEVVRIGLVSERKKRLPGWRNKEKGAVSESMERTGSLHLAGREFNTLSGGEKQKVSLARCLAQKPRLLVLDEPTTGLDSESRENLIKVIMSLDLSVIAVSHDYELANSPGFKKYRIEDMKIVSDDKTRQYSGNKQ